MRISSTSLRLAQQALFGFSLVVALSCSPSAREAKRPQPVAIDGVLDLRDWRPERDGHASLTGEWHFFWKDLVDPALGCESAMADGSASEIPESLKESYPGEEGAGTGYVSLLYLDVDRFKDINDRFGHDVGDEILIKIAGVIREQVRSYDLSVRLGGDEFAVLLRDIDFKGAHLHARRLREKLSEPMRVGDADFRIDVSVGVATLPADRVDLALLLRRADRAMYTQKRPGRGPGTEGRPA